uniref:Uncharacterized protein n=1 Tax=Rhinolophus ferrumequinum TaxID=59479 RepID=A0A671ED33_RHIFE
QTPFPLHFHDKAKPQPPPIQSFWSGNNVSTIKIEIWPRVFRHSSPPGWPTALFSNAIKIRIETFCQEVGKGPNTRLSSPQFFLQPKSVLATEHAPT